MEFKLELSGPVFDGSGRRTARALGGQIRNDLADIAQNGVTDVLASPWPNGIRERTPVLETKINTDKSKAHTSRVNYDGTEYGHWIEGSGSRNRPRPGFPGYHAFEKSYAGTVAAIPAVVERRHRAAVDKMNGR